MERKDIVTIKKSSLHRLAYTVPLCSFFLYFSKLMLFGPSTLWLPGVRVSEDLQISFSDVNGNTFLTGYSEFSKPEWKAPEFCRYQQNNAQTGCLEDPHNQLIKVMTDDSGVEGVTCHQVRREGLRCVNQVVMDCFHLGDAHWYGGFESAFQMWPLKKSVAVPKGVMVGETEEVAEPDGVELPMGAYVTSDIGVHKTQVASVLDRLFFSSTGVGIMVSRESPLHLSFNAHRDKKICLAGTYDGSNYVSHSGRPPVLEYTVCKAGNVRNIHEYMRKRFIDKPEGIPNEELFKKPIWSTWAQYRKEINQSAVLKFADEIKSHNLPASQLEIDDKWMGEYGDLEFDPVKFPDPKAMVAELNKKGFPVSLWVHPFLNLESKAFKEVHQLKFGVMLRNSETLALTKWWNADMAALMDVSNPAAVLWFQKKLKNLQEITKVSSFKFDAGEGMFLPAASHTSTPLLSSKQYSTLWAELAYNADSIQRRQDIRVGWNSQRLPMFVRIIDRLSDWSRQGGLASVIPTVFTMGVIGYPFVLPDMIGGNAYVDLETMGGVSYPDRELYIRWLQLNTFMPSMQFSVVPWMYDNDVVAIAKKCLKLREEYASKFIELAHQSTQTGAPIVRPLWWVAPNDETALTVDDEFLVGDNLLIAPIVVEGARRRDIYLPEGTWLDKAKRTEETGPTTLKEYPVALDELPIFERIQSAAQ